MKVSAAYAGASLDEIKAALDGGTLTVYSVARPPSADLPVERSDALATFTFAAPAFGAASDKSDNALFIGDPVEAVNVGTPGFARACKADGTVVADFSAGPGNREIKFAEVSCSKGAPVRIAAFEVLEESSWPERPDYFYTKPRAGFLLPQAHGAKPVPPATHV